MRLENKVAVITGGARGIGRAAAELFAHEGAKVVISDVLDDEGNELESVISKRGASATFVHADVTKEAEMASLMTAVNGIHGRLDILLANAGIFLTGALDEFSEEDYDRMMNINVKGVWLSCKHAIPLLRASGEGVIVISASAVGLKGSGRSPLYAASKGAVLLMGRSIALQTARENIRCNMVCAGPVATELYESAGLTLAQVEQREKEWVPLGRVGQVDDVAHAMLYLASDEAKFCTGSVLAVDGGVNA